MPLRDRSGQRWQPSGKPYVVAATEVCSRFIGTCRELSSPLLPLPFPFLSLLFGVFLNGILRITLLFLWCVPGRTFLSLLSLSLSLSFLLSFLSLPSSWVSLDAFVIAGNPFPLFLWCVPGRLCRSWDTFFPFPFFSFFFSSLPTPSSRQDLSVGCY